MRPMRFYLPTPIPEKKLAVGVIEKDGRIARWLESRGHKVVLPYGEVLPDVVVIGEDCVTEARLRLFGFEISKRVEKMGMRLVILQQRAWNPEGISQKICDGLVSSPLREPAGQVFPEVDAVRQAVGGDLD